MTIGIGVLATEENALNAKPSHLVLIADTMGSFGDSYSHPRLHKLFAFPETDLYAASANQIDQAATLMPMINANLVQIAPEKRSYGDILRGIAQSLFMFKVEKFNLTVLPRYGMPPASIAPNSSIAPSSLIESLVVAPADIQAKLEREWEDFNLGCDLIIGAFDKTGQAVLVYVYGDESVFHNGTFPGYWAIGSGAENAIFWLSYREHVLGMGLQRAAYHAYEAKLMAEGSPHVNEHLDIIVATKSKYWNITTHKPNEQTDCPVSFEKLREWRDKYGPAKTDALSNVLR